MNVATAAVIEASDISKQVMTAAGELSVLEAIDVQLAAGESLAIVGESGSGKTTLLSLLAGLDAPSSGRIALFGSELSGLDEDGRAALDWGIYGAPESFLVDAQGVVRWKFVGPITPEVVRDQLMPELEKLK